jgi:hypothetical protein
MRRHAYDRCGTSSPASFDGTYIKSEEYEASVRSKADGNVEVTIPFHADEMHFRLLLGSRLKSKANDPPGSMSDQPSAYADPISAF